MHDHNACKDANIFKPTPFNKTVVFDEPDTVAKQMETPFMYLKSTVKNGGNAMNLSIFNFSFADINQVLPEIEFQTDEEKPIEEIGEKVEEEARRSECESTKMAQESAKSVKVSKRLKLLEDACESLTKVFNEVQMCAMDVNLAAYENELLKCITAKKFTKEGVYHANSEIARSEGEELAQLANQLYSKHASRKRKEEKIKFVFKHTLKNLKKAFFTAHDLHNSMESEVRFFTNYFTRIHVDRNLPLETFFDPLNTSHALNPKFKTLSKDYLALLFSSDNFRSDFLGYIDKEFVSDYQSNVSKKFKKLFKKLRKRMRQAGTGKYEVVIGEFIEKFNANKRCKLPWTKREISDAIIGFSSHLENL